MSNRKKIRAALFGIFGSFALALFYFLVTGLASGDWQFPLKQFGKFWYLMTPLVLGFGVQVGLFQYLRLKKAGTLGARASSGANAGLSGISMVACCAHHLTEVLPFLGFSAASLVLSRYQGQLLAFGVLSNALGIFLMLRILQNHAKVKN